ncbi:MAG: hypothetical protein PVF66_11995, partial [Candidatus Aminicenantes bacterium]
MGLFFDSIKDYLTKQPFPHAAFHLTSRYISGIRVSPKDGRIMNHFILPLEKGLIQPSFEKKNIKNPSLLEKKIEKELGKLHLHDHKVACLLPELSLRAFVFSFGSLPSSRPEREQVIRFRIKKQLPLLPQDARFSFDVIKSNDSMKIFVAVARALIIQEYEELFSKFNLKVRTVGVPILGLHSLLDTEKEKDLLLINIEEDSLCLAAIMDSEIALYRMKPILSSSQDEKSEVRRVEHVVKEVENTVNFVEDRENRKIRSFCIRQGFFEEEKILSHLQ